MNAVAAKVILAMKVLLAIVLVGWGIWAVGYSRGHAAAQQGEMQRREAAIRQSIRTYEAELQRGEQAATSMRTQLAALNSTNDDLNRRLANVPRFVVTPQCPNPGAVQLSRAGVLRLNAAIGHPELPAGAGGDAGPVAGAGSSGDRVDAPVAAGPDGRMDAASGVGIDEAQAHTEANLRRCEAIRTRCQSLIDYLQDRQDRKAQLPQTALEPQD
jgi:hypothetical protein